MEEWFMCCVGNRKPNPPPEKLIKHLDEPREATTTTSSPPPSAAQAPSLRPMNELPFYYEVDWSPKGELGKGHFARVYRGKHRLTGVKVAAKRIVRSGTKKETLQTEIRALAKLSHPNIVRLYDVFFDDVYVVLMLELLSGGELFARIVKGGTYSERDASKHFFQLCNAMKYMHEQGVTHRDLKPENLVLAEPRLDSPIKISDFGLSKILEASKYGPESMNQMTTVCGTKAYAAPEINFENDPAKRGAPYSNKVDVWSMGVILYVILGGYHPFDPYGNYKDDMILHKIATGDWSFNDAVWDKISPLAKDLLKKMICVDPEKRLSMSQVLEHDWFKLANVSILSESNLFIVENRAFREKMKMDIDSQTTFSTRTNQTTAIGDSHMSVIDETKEDKEFV